MSNSGSSSLWVDTAAGQQVQSRLAEERTLLAMDRLLARLDTIEAAVASLATVMHQGPGLVAMASDMVDAGYRRADERGVNIDERLQNALALAERLTSPSMIEKLNGVLTLADQLPGLTAMTVDVVDAAYRRADASGISIDDRLAVALELAEKLTAPPMLEKINGLLTLSDQLPGLAAMTLDIVDDKMRTAIDNGLDPQAMLHWAGQAATAVVNAQQEPPAKVGGVFGLLRALNDPDRQKALGFLMNLLKHLGRTL